MKHFWVQVPLYVGLLQPNFFFSVPYLEIAREQMCDSPATVFWIKSN